MLFVVQSYLYLLSNQEYINIVSFNLLQFIFKIYEEFNKSL